MRRNYGYSKDDSVLKNWDDPYNGCAIYALVDENGKAYIGKSKKLNNRLFQHRMYMNKIKAVGTADHEGEKIAQAIREGHVFTVKILIKPMNVTHNQLCELEKHFFNLYGGINKTYNSTYPTNPSPYYDKHPKIL